MNIFMIQHNYQSKYLVIIDSVVNVYKYEKCKFDQPFLSYQPKQVFIGKIKNCPMTEFSQNQDRINFDGNTFLLECENNEYVYISGLELVKFEIEDKIIDYISLMGNNMIAYPIAVGEKFTYFLYNRWKFLENDKIEEGSLLNRINNSLDPFDYHVEKCGADFFKKLECSLIHTYWPDRRVDDDDVVEEDVLEQEENLIETPYLNGDTEVVKIFNEKCVTCLEKDSIYAFRHCGHQCICEDCYQNKGNIDILKCVVCRR